MDVFLYNPRSRKNTGEKRIRKITKRWKHPYILYNVLEINKVEIFKALSDDDRIILVGGDGTVHHFAEDIKNYDLKQEAYLIPCGTGNDFRNSIKEKGKMIKINRYVKNLPQVSFSNSTQVFVNGCGLGMDGYVCSLVNTHNNKGRLCFFKSTIKAFVKYKPKRIKVIVDGKEYSYKKVYLASIMNGAYQGGGMKMTPKSKRLDHTIEVCVICNISKFALLLMFPFIYFGKHTIKRKSVKILSGKEISIVSEESLYMQIDGEDYMNIKEIKARR